MLSLYIDESDRDFLTGSGREPAICELRCENCGDGLRYDQNRCATCGYLNPRFVELEFDSRITR
jgi:uncharacterized OB-fold protein